MHRKLCISRRFEWFFNDKQWNFKINELLLVYPTVLENFIIMYKNEIMFSSIRLMSGDGFKSCSGHYRSFVSKRVEISIS